MIRVLVVDDSLTARALIEAMLASDPELEVCGVAGDGLEAVAEAKRLRPSLIVMDVRMPGCDGFEATRRIMAETPTPIVIVSGTIDVRDVEHSLEALRAGALALLPKPEAPGTPEFEGQRRHLVSTVKAMSQVKLVRRHAPARASLSPPVPLRGVALARRVIAVAASTGGPGALHRVLTELPQGFPLPILVVQHIAIGFASGLASWLAHAARLDVKVAQHGELLQPGRVYLAPDEHHLAVDPGGAAVRVLDGAPVHGFRPSATVLFQSVAKAFGRAGVAVMLTGMGEDGVAGLREVHDAGGHVIAQDEATSVVFGMPGAAVAAGITDEVLPLERIPSRLAELL